MPARRGRGRKRTGDSGGGGPPIAIMSRQEGQEGEDLYPVTGYKQPPIWREVTNPDTGLKEKYNMSDPEQASIVMKYARKFGEIKGVKGGAKNKIDTAITSRRIEKGEIWEKWLIVDATIDEKTGKNISENLKGVIMKKWLSDETKGKLTVSERSWKRWLGDNPVPEGWIPEVFDMEKTDAYQRWDKWSKTGLLPKVKKGYKGGIRNFQAYWMRMEHDWAWAEKTIDPNTPEGLEYWDQFIQDVKGWQHWLSSPEGGAKSVATVSKLTVSLRSLLREGTTNTPNYVINAIDVQEAGKKKFPEEIHYIRGPEMARHVNSLPPVGRLLLYERKGEKKGKPVINKTYFTLENESQRKMFQAAMWFSFTTGARSGALPEGDYVASRIAYEKTEGVLLENKNLYNAIVFGGRESSAKPGGSAQAARGIVSMRLTDIRLKQKIPIYDAKAGEATHTEGAIVRRIHEKMDHTWRNFPIPPMTQIAIKEYLKERFKDELKPNDYNADGTVKWDAFISRYHRKELVQFNKLQAEAVIDLQKAINDGVSEKKYSDLRKSWARKLLSKYQNQLLFEYKRELTGNRKNIHIATPETAFRNSTYACFRNAEMKGRPIEDEAGDDFTPERMLDNSEESPWHFYRKCFAQNMREKGMPLDVLARYAVGWDDLSTLEKIYARLDPRTRLKYYKEVVAPMFAAPHTLKPKTSPKAKTPKKAKTSPKVGKSIKKSQEQAIKVESLSKMGADRRGDIYTVRYIAEAYNAEKESNPDYTDLIPIAGIKKRIIKEYPTVTQDEINTKLLLLERERVVDLQIAYDPVNAIDKEYGIPTERGHVMYVRWRTSK